MSRAAVSVVATPHNEIEAHIIAAVLRGEGIPVHVEGLNSALHDAGVFHQLFPVRVPATCLETAVDVLTAVRRGALERGRRGGDDPEDLSVARIEATLCALYRYIVIGLLFPPLGLVAGLLACRCSQQAMLAYDRLLVDQRDLEGRIETAAAVARNYTAAYYVSVIAVMCYVTGIVR